MSADWQTFLGWLAEGGTQTPDEAWERFSALAAESDRAEVLALISAGTGMLPDESRLSVAVGVATLMAELEGPPQADALRMQVASALGEILAELDPGRTRSIAAVLFQQPISKSLRSMFSVFTAELQLAQQMLAAAPATKLQNWFAATLCNSSLVSLLCAFRMAWEQANEIQRFRIHDARVAFEYALTRYNTATRQLNDALGEVLFADTSPLQEEG